MIEVFFAALIGGGALILGLYSYFHDRRNLIFLLTLLPLALLSLTQWQYSAIFFIFFFASLWAKSYSRFISMSMFSAIMLSFFFLKLFIETEIFYLSWIAIIAVIGICALAIFGIFEDSLRKYFFLSNAAQLVFVVLDLSIAKMFGKLGALGTIQIFNYFFAGLLLFTAVGVLSLGKKRISELKGSYFANKWNDVAATVAALSLAGLPLFNMFVSEWALFTASFSVLPVVTVLGIFAALLLFVMYYKLVYVLLVGEGSKICIPRTITVLNLILAVICVLLGVLPQLQFAILGGLV